MKRKKGFVYDNDKIKYPCICEHLVCLSHLPHESSPHLRPLFRDDGIVDVCQALALQGKQADGDGGEINKYSP